MTDLATTLRREVEVDTKLADIWAAESKAEHYRTYAFRTLALAVDLKPVRFSSGRGDYIKETPAEVLALADAMLADPDTASWDKHNIEDSVARYAKHRDEVERLREKARPFNEEYDANPWSRFFLVKNHSGHIHSSMHCSTCFPTTRFGWLPELSGLTEKDAVDAHGPLLCSVCFPSAPVEWTLGKKDDDDVCGGRPDWDKPHRKGFYTGNWATCSECGEHVTLTKNWNLRKHKKT